MLALDTNVLVRFLVEDDPKQSAAAAALIARAAAADEPVFVSDIVVCEVVWVLAAAYRVGRAEIASTLRELLRARSMVFEAADELSRALDAYSDGRGDFADYLIREHARAAGCEAVATFDKLLRREAGFAAP